MKWETLTDGIKLSLDNAERLNTDAEVLLKRKRLVTSNVLLAFAKEELGKAILIMEYWVSRRNMSYKDYVRFFRSREAHNEKLRTAGRAFLKADFQVVLGDFLARQERTQRERKLYVDYDFALNSWIGPVQEFDDLFEEYGIGSVKHYREMKEAGERIDKITQSEDIIMMKKTIVSLRELVKRTAHDFAQTGQGTVSKVITFVPKKRKVEVTNEFKVDELVQMLSEYEGKMRDMDKQAQRDKKWDYTILERSMVDEYLSKLTRTFDKKALLLYAIGILRRNIHNEYSARALNLEKSEKYSEAAQTMNEYATTVAIRFARAHKFVPPPIKTLLNLLAERRRVPAFDYTQKWKDSYGSWTTFTQHESDMRKIAMRYFELRADFNMLYAMSWSSKNFPHLEEWAK